MAGAGDPGWRQTTGQDRKPAGGAENAYVQRIGLAARRGTVYVAYEDHQKAFQPYLIKSATPARPG